MEKNVRNHTTQYVSNCIVWLLPSIRAFFMAGFTLTIMSDSEIHVAECIGVYVSGKEVKSKLVISAVDSIFLRLRFSCLEV